MELFIPSCGHGPVEKGSGGAAADPIAVMRTIEVVELQEGAQAAIERGPTGEIVAAEDDAPVLGQDGLLQALDEAVRPGMTGLNASLADPQGRTGRGELGFEFVAAIGQHARQGPAGAPDGRPHDVAQEAGGGRGRQGRQDTGDAVRGGRVAGRDLPHFAHALELADVEGVQADELAGPGRRDVARAPVPQTPEGLPGRSVSKPARRAL